MTIATPRQTAAVDQLLAALNDLTAIDRYAITGMFQIMVDSTDPELQRVHLALLEMANLIMASITPDTPGGTPTARTADPASKTPPLSSDPRPGPQEGA